MRKECNINVNLMGLYLDILISYLSLILNDIILVVSHFFLRSSSLALVLLFDVLRCRGLPSTR